MGLRKLCLELVILSVLSALVGVWALIYAGERVSELGSLKVAERKDGTEVTLEADAVLPYVYFIAKSESEGHLYRYYPVRYQESPARFVLVCVPSDRFAEFEAAASGSGKKLSIAGRLCDAEARVKTTIDTLTQAMTEADSQGRDYKDLFLDCYVEIANVRDNTVQRVIGYILLIGGVLFAGLGALGFFRFKNVTM